MQNLLNLRLTLACIALSINMYRYFNSKQVLKRLRQRICVYSSLFPFLLNWHKVNKAFLLTVTYYFVTEVLDNIILLKYYERRIQFIFTVEDLWNWKHHSLGIFIDWKFHQTTRNFHEVKFTILLLLKSRWN